MQFVNSQKKTGKIGKGAGALLLALVYANIAAAQVMTSTNYSIQSDSLNAGGGLSTSTNYSIESTAGEIATGYSSSTNYNLHAGYQQMDSVFLSISAPSNVTLAPAIPSVGGGTADGSTSVTVTTDSAAGYQLTIQAAASPALASGSGSFADYAPAGADPDFGFTVAAASSAFGFSPEGSDIASTFKDDGAACNAGASDTADSCWAGLGTAGQLIAERSNSNMPAGTATVLKFRAESGAAHTQAAGTYSAVTTLTAIAL